MRAFETSRMLLRFSPITVLLWICNAALVGMIAAAFIDDPQIAAATRASSAPAIDAITDLDMPMPAWNADAVQSQALFHASRSFHIPVEPATVNAPPPDYRFTGAMGAPNKPLIGLLVHNQTNARTKVSANDQLDGWRVEEVTPRYVVVTFEGRRHEISPVRSTGSVDNNLVSSTAAAPGGLVVIPAGQAASQRTTSEPSRVLSGDGKANPPAAANPTINESAPRLYRPPSQ